MELKAPGGSSDDNKQIPPEQPRKRRPQTAINPEKSLKNNAKNKAEANSDG